MNAAVASSVPKDVPLREGNSADTAGRGPAPSSAPCFRRFQTTCHRRRPSRLSGILRSIEARKARTDGPPSSAATVTPSWEQFGIAARSASSPVPDDGPAAADRRRFLRRLSRHLVRILPYRDIDVAPEDLEWALHESPLRGQMSNLSMNGVAFRLKQPLTVSARVWLKLECRTRDFAVIRTGRIIRVTPRSETEWTVTCRFDHCVPYADVVQLSQQMA